jgi:S1-C subfamily serine protease
MGVGESPIREHLTYVLSLSNEYDLALLKIVGEIPLHGIARLADKSPGVGEKLYIVGHPHGLTYTHTEGNVGAYRVKLPEAEDDKAMAGPYLQVSAPVWKGNSGGGAFNEEGELIGICSFMVGVPNSSFFVHLDTLRGMMIGAKLLKINI